MDALDNLAFNQLVGEGFGLQTARKEMPSRAEEIFERDYHEPLHRVTYKPRGIVLLRSTFGFLTSTTRITTHHPDMDRPDKDCKDLINETGRALEFQTLRLLSLSLQRNNLEMCIKTVINRWVRYLNFFFIVHLAKCEDPVGQSFHTRNVSSVFKIDDEC
jgi:hypothetical protein